MLSEGFVWALAAGVGMIGFGLGIIVTSYRGPTRHSAWNSTYVAFLTGAAIVAMAIWFAPHSPPPQ